MDYEGGKCLARNKQGRRPKAPPEEEDVAHDVGRILDNATS